VLLGLEGAVVDGLGLLHLTVRHARMSSAVARPIRSSSKTLTSSKLSYFLRLPGPAVAGPDAKKTVGVGVVGGSGVTRSRLPEIRSRRRWTPRWGGATGRCRALR